MTGWVSVYYTVTDRLGVSILYCDRLGVSILWLTGWVSVYCDRLGVSIL